MHHTRPPAFPASILRCATSINCWLATRRYRRSHHGHYEAEHAQHIVFPFLFFNSLLCRWIVELVIQCPETNFNQWESNKKEEIEIRWFERLNFYGRGTEKKRIWFECLEKWFAKWRWFTDWEGNLLQGPRYWWQWWQMQLNDIVRGTFWLEGTI